MKLKFKYISIFIIWLGIVFAAHAGTFKPFIRSRYSIRWRKTTEAPKVWYSSTSAVKEGIEKTSLKSPIEVSEGLTDSSTQLATIKTLYKSSTHSTDYDYYNNEVDEEHKN